MSESAEPAPRCNPLLPSAHSPVPHDYAVTDTEYGDLGSGGSYEVLECQACQRIAYRPLPD